MTPLPRLNDTTSLILRTDFSIANLDFDDFAASTDQSGTFRGFDE